MEYQVIKNKTFLEPSRLVFKKRKKNISVVFLCIKHEDLNPYSYKKIEFPSQKIILKPCPLTS